MALAKDLFALSPSAQEKQSIASLHGVDIVLGGHDHMYYIGKGVTSWEGYDIKQLPLGAEQDYGDVLVVKSGTDFRDLSSFTLTLESTPEGSVRKKVIKAITGSLHIFLMNAGFIRTARPAGGDSTGIEIIRRVSRNPQNIALLCIRLPQTSCMQITCYT